MTTELKKAYIRVIAADNHWSALLEKTYGKRSHECRFTVEGYATPELNNAKAEFIHATDKYRSLLPY